MRAVGHVSNRIPTVVRGRRAQTRPDDSDRYTDERLAGTLRGDTTRDDAVHGRSARDELLRPAW